MEKSINEEVFIFENQPDMNIKLFNLFVSLQNAAFNEKGFFTVALSGGKTPESFYKFLAANAGKAIDWDKVFVFFTDERFIQLTQHGSNFKMVFDSLLSNIQIPHMNIFPVNTDLPSKEEAAIDYENTLKKFLKLRNNKKVNQGADLVFLGVGTDGHTASLFSKKDCQNDDNLLCISTTAPKKYEIKERISLTLDMINSCENVIFIITGLEKSDIVYELFKKRDTSKEKFPAGKISPQKNIYWFLDKDAASQII